MSVCSTQPGCHAQRLSSKVASSARCGATSPYVSLMAWPPRACTLPTFSSCTVLMEPGFVTWSLSVSGPLTGSQGRDAGSGHEEGCRSAGGWGQQGEAPCSEGRAVLAGGHRRDSGFRLPSAPSASHRLRDCEQVTSWCLQASVCCRWGEDTRRGLSGLLQPIHGAVPMSPDVHA